MPHGLVCSYELVPAFILYSLVYVIFMLFSRQEVFQNAGYMESNLGIKKLGIPAPGLGLNLGREKNPFRFIVHCSSIIPDHSREPLVVQLYP